MNYKCICVYWYILIMKWMLMFYWFFISNLFDKNDDIEFGILLWMFCLYIYKIFINVWIMYYILRLGDKRLV